MKKRILALLLALMLAAGPALAEVIYITDIVVSARPLDGSTPEPTAEPTAEPTQAPTAEPTEAPTAEPTAKPTAEPTPAPTEAPTEEPTAEPTVPPVVTAEPSPTPQPYEGEYEIEVDLNNQIVTVYRAGGRTAFDIARQMICSSGTGDNTPLGEFIMPENQKPDEREEWYYIGQYQLYVQYASRIVGSILFHSLPSERRGTSPTTDSYEALGTPASHGCIRLRPADSRWIAENCPAGTKVYIFGGNFANDELRKHLMRTSFSNDEMTYGDFLGGEVLLSISSELPEVSALQEKLQELGYNISKVDGLFGAETHAAVVLWQQENGYEATGEMNEEQLEALLGTAVSAETKAKPGYLGRVKVDTALILRSEPNAQSRKITSLPNGTSVRVLDEVRGWYKVNADGQTGYVGRNYIELSN